MVLVSVYWSWDSRPFSLPPNPESLYPPNGVVLSPSLKQLTETVPALSARAYLWALVTS